MPDITPYRHDLEVIRDTARQVIKDFGMAGIEIQFSGNAASAYHELTEQALPGLRKLYQANQASFMALLYRIDVEEKKVREVSENFTGNAFFENLANLIIEREFIKVVIRKLYSSRNG